LDVPSFVHSQLVLTETLFTFVLTLAVWAGVAALQYASKPTGWFWVQGFLLALATLIRPIAYYAIFVVAFTFVIILKTRFHWSWKSLLFSLAGLMIPWMILVGGWQLRNYYAVGSAELSTTQGINLLFYRGAYIIAQRDGISFEEAQQRLGYDNYQARYPETQNWSESQLAQHWKQEGLRLIRQYPGLFLKSQVWGIAKMMLDPGDHILLGYLGKHREQTGPGGDLLTLPFKQYLPKWLISKTGLFTLFFLTESYVMLLYSGILVFLWRLVRANNRASACPEKDPVMAIHLILWALMLYFIVLSAGPEAYARFRIPLMPLLSLYGGQGVFIIFSHAKNAKNAKKKEGKKLRRMLTF
jgi:hypothetical protein